MNVNSVSNSYGISSLDPLSTQTQGQVDLATAVGSSTNSDVSDFASVMNSLQELSQSDPTKFKEVMGSVASTLQADASNATGSQAQFLSQLADKFQQASQTGSMSPLQPPSGGHHHHHHGVKGYSGQQSSSSDGSTQQPPFDVAQIVQTAMQQAGVTVSS